MPDYDSPEVPDLMKNLQDSINAVRAVSRELRQPPAVRASDRDIDVPPPSSSSRMTPERRRDQARETQIPSKTGDQHFGAVDGLTWMNLRDRAWELLARTPLLPIRSPESPVAWHAHPRVYALMRRVPTAPGSPTTGIEVRPPSTVDTGIRLYLFGIRVIESAQVEDLALVIPA